MKHVLNFKERCFIITLLLFTWLGVNLQSWPQIITKLQSLCLKILYIVLIIILYYLKNIEQEHSFIWRILEGLFLMTKKSKSNGDSIIIYPCKKYSWRVWLQNFTKCVCMYTALTGISLFFCLVFICSG